MPGGTRMVDEDQPIQLLTLEEASEMLNLMGIPVPNNNITQYILNNISDYMENWLGYRPLATNYIGDFRSNTKGLILLNEYPVLSVKRVERYIFRDPNNLQNYQFDYTYRAEAWRQTGNNIQVYTQGDWFQVEWMAGLDPLPRQFKSAAIGLLELSITQGVGVGGFLSPTSILSAPTFDTTSVGVPGGLSKSVTLGSANTSAAGIKRGLGDGTSGDRIMTNYLAKYRRRILFATGGA